MRAVATLIVLTLSLFCAKAGDRLANETYFQNIEGHWLGEGSLTNADGEITPISEDWKGAYLEDGSFEIRGTRLWGEDRQDFYWRYIHNESLDLLECEYWHTGVEDPVLFEVSLTGTSVEMRAPFGEPGGELKISNALEGGKIVGEITLIDRAGVELLTGEVIHEKAEEEAE